MKNQALFSSKDKRKKLKYCLLQFLFGALRVKKNETLAASCRGSKSIIYVSLFSGAELRY